MQGVVRSRVVERLFYLEQGLKVLLHCRHGHHRTGVAIYLAPRPMVEEPAQCLSMLKEMRPTMHKEIVPKTKHRHLVVKAETISASPVFRAGVSCMTCVVEAASASSCGCVRDRVNMWLEYILIPPPGVLYICTGRTSLFSGGGWDVHW